MKTEQETLHQAISNALPLKEDEVLTGWILVWETVRADEQEQCGHYYGPATMTTWRALGLLEWARRFTLHPDATDGDGD